MMKKLLMLSLSATLLLGACVKKKDQPVGNTHIRFVNAIPNSVTQDVYINSDLVYGGKLGSNIYSPYIDHQAGIFNIAAANTGTTDPNIMYSYATSIGEYTTVFFFQDFNGNLVSGGLVDDMTPPSAGKAKVRFANVDNYSLTSFTMSIAGGANLFQSLVFGTSSKYFEVDPGTKFTATATKVADPLSIDFGLEAGKIYTIWIGADSVTDLQAHGLIQNYQ